jgi:hypothetical protein
MNTHHCDAISGAELYEVLGMLFTKNKYRDADVRAGQHRVP